VSKADIPKAVRFEVTGSRQLLGEEQRTARFINTSGLLAQNPMTAQRVDWDEVSRQMWEDTGVKDPDRFLIQGEVVDPQVEQLSQQLQAVQQEAGEQIQKLEGSLQQETTKKLELQVEVQQNQAIVSARDQEIRLLKAEKRSLDEIAREKDAVEQEKADTENLIRDAQDEIRDKMSQQTELFTPERQEPVETAPTSQVINLNTAANKRITLTRDGSGNLTGADVESSSEATEG
jgi:DNA mismatch repair ATPase MutS